ncbi:MAG: tRNA (adenosine(37)-N6)-threonylcarbamoyltransferase complex ATPase subunit type 1 TsaE [Acidobacteriota bacterium]
MRSEEIVTRGGAETEGLGERLASSLSSGDVVYLHGELGAGKTTLARGLARGLGALPREVASPTFALLHEYANADGAIVLRHLDLYRLADDPRDLAVLGLPDAVAGAPVCVEWARGAIRRLLPPSVEVTIQADADDGRRIRIQRE